MVALPIPLDPHGGRGLKISEGVPEGAGLSYPGSSVVSEADDTCRAVLPREND